MTTPEPPANQPNDPWQGSGYQPPMTGPQFPQVPGAQPYYPPPAPPYAQPYPNPYQPYPPPAPSTNGMAIAAMILGILWIYWIGSILALIFGYVARDQIKRNGQSGDGMAIAGIVLGWVGVGILIIILGVTGIYLSRN